MVKIFHHQEEVEAQAEIKNTGTQSLNLELTFRLLRGSQVMGRMVYELALSPNQSDFALGFFKMEDSYPFQTYEIEFFVKDLDTNELYAKAEEYFELQSY